MKWDKLKKQVQSELIESGILPQSEAGKAILRYERAANTIRNKLYTYNRSFSSLSCSGEMDYATKCLEVLNDCGGFNRNNVKFSKEYKKYCESLGVCFNHSLGDALC